MRRMNEKEINEIVGMKKKNKRDRTCKKKNAKDINRST
jgi:hypothetical protein